jgi:CheY-like chemotaxis protein
MPPTILHAEDLREDAFLFERALRSVSGNDLQLKHSADGQAAVDFLVALDALAVSQLELVILDIKMPRRSGFEVLSWIRQQARYRTLPVVMFSSSAEPGDVENSYSLGANSYLTKPLEFDRLTELVQTLTRYWCHFNQRVPPRLGSQGTHLA